jgi:hypothetical protein
MIVLAWSMMGTLLAALGMLFGLVGSGMSLARRGLGLPTCLAGTAVCASALFVALNWPAPVPPIGSEENKRLAQANNSPRQPDGEAAKPKDSLAKPREKEPQPEPAPRTEPPVEEKPVEPKEPEKKPAPDSTSTEEPEKKSGPDSTKTEEPEKEPTPAPAGSQSERKPSAEPDRPAEPLPKARGTTYVVGDGKRYTSLGAVPWLKLRPGDMVQIHWREKPYREKIHLPIRGAKGAPISIIGVPGPGGALPVIDGDGAVSNPDLFLTYEPLETLAIFLVAPRGDEPGKTYKPGWLLFENLEIKNAHRTKMFTSKKGAKMNYGNASSAIAMYKCEHITIRNCKIHNCENGLFGKSFGDEQGTLRDVLVESCRIYDTGFVGSDRFHNCYLEGIGITYQYNHFSRQIKGSGGSCIKDRSAGTVIRYNRLEGGAHLLDLVEPEDGGALIMKDPSYPNTYVYGNTLYNPPMSGCAAVIHFGGDLGTPSEFRKNLHYYNNTFVCRDDQATGQWRNIFFAVETNEQVLEARNNIFFLQPATKGQHPPEFSFVDEHGTVRFGRNWVSKGWIPCRSGSALKGVYEGKDQLINGDRPGFVDPVQDWHLRDDSPCKGKGGPLSAEEAKLHPLTRQYVHPRLSEPRPQGDDLGAFAAKR